MEQWLMEIFGFPVPAALAGAAGLLTFGDTGPPGGGFECMYIVFFVFPVAAFLVTVFLYLGAALLAGAAFGFTGAAAGALAGAFGGAAAYAAFLAARAAAGFFSRRPSYIKTIRRAPPPPPELAGGKGSSLFKILNADCETPRGFILCAPAFSGVRREPPEGPPERIHWPVRTFKLKRALRSHFHADEKVVVRSSFPGEDSAAASFAGVYDSVRDVPARDADAVADAVIKVYSSYWSRRAAAYRKTIGLAPDGPAAEAPPAAAIVQLQADPEWSGVAFSVNPHTGHREEYVVEAQHGAGNHNIYILNRMTGIWRSPSPEECPALPFLERALPRLERQEGCPVQIEWGMCGDSFPVFQSRPATGVPEVKTYTNSYIVETPPYPLTPLSISFLENIPSGFERFLPPAARSGKLWKVFDSRLYVDYELARSMAEPGGVRESLRASKSLAAMALRLALRRRAFEKAVRNVTAAGRAGYGIEKFLPGEAGRVLAEGFQLQAAAVLLYTLCDAALRRLYAPEPPPPPEGVFSAMSGAAGAGLDTDTAKELLDLNDDAWIEAAEQAAAGADVKPDGVPDRAAAAMEKLVSSVLRRSNMPLELSARREGGTPALSAARARESVRIFLRNSFAEKTPPPRDPEAMIPWKTPAARILRGLRGRMNGLRERLGLELDKAFGAAAAAAAVTGGLFAEKGIIPDQDDVFFLRLEEVTGPSSDLQAAAAEIPARREKYEAALAASAPPALHVLNGSVIEEEFITAPSGEPGAALEGIGNNRGAAEGSALVLSKPEFSRPELMKGVILVTGAPSPDWIAWLPHVDGLVVETGGALCHLMLAASELGVPAVAGAAGATKLLETGMVITLDSASGRVTVKEPGNPPQAS